MRLFRLTNLLLPVLTALTLSADGPSYRSVSVDPAGRLHIVPDSGNEILPPKLPGQVSFGDAAISSDRRSVGWLVMYPDPTVTYEGAQIGGRLAVFRAGRVIHTFTTEQVFWDWQFQDGGKRVAYSTGPTHGGVRAPRCRVRAHDRSLVGQRRKNASDLGADASPVASGSYRGRSSTTTWPSLSFLPSLP
jgi:hypothetical protein